MKKKSKACQGHGQGSRQMTQHCNPGCPQATRGHAQGSTTSQDERTISIQNRIDSSSSSEVDELECPCIICNTSNPGYWIQCDCWVHRECVNISVEIDVDILDWICPDC